MKKWFLCQCSGEAICVERYDDDDSPTEFWFSLFRMGDYKPSLKNRIKWAWRVLRRGDIHADQVIFSIETTRELMDYLQCELSN